jgi:hypothetical protein
MTLEIERKCIGVFAKLSDAELAIQELKTANFSMQKVSVIAQKPQQKSEIAGIEVKDNTGNTSEESNGALGRLTGLLLGISVLIIPSIGQVMLAGTEAMAIATTLTGDAIAAGSFAGALLAFGISEEQAQVYSDLIFKGYCLVIVTAKEVEIRFAKRIFNRCSVEQWGLYQPYFSPKNRYKHAVGVFGGREDAEKALTELRKAGFPMNQVSIITKDNYNTLGIPDDVNKYYEHQLNLGNFLLLINATDIYIAGARAILESNKIQHFRIYSQSAVNGNKNRSDRQVMSNF